MTRTALAAPEPLPPRTRRILRHPRRKRRRREARPALRFSPAAWAKLLYLRDRGPTEVGGFGVSPAEDLLYVEDVRLVRQRATCVTVRFEDAAVADFFDEQIDAGRRPGQFARLWVHTHPGDCPEPSGTDEETFARAFGRADWALMVILAAGGQTYARLQFHVGPGGALRLPVEVDWQRPFAAADHDAWEQEYLGCVQGEPLVLASGGPGGDRALPSEWAWPREAEEFAPAGDRLLWEEYEGARFEL